MATSSNLTYKQAEALRKKLNTRGIFNVSVMAYEPSGSSSWSGKGRKKASKYRVDYRANPARRKTARRKNAPKSRTISLKGFTGKIKQLANGALSIQGKGRKK